MHHGVLRAHLDLHYGSDADALCRLFREEIAAMQQDGPTPADLHRLAGTVGLLGDMALANHLRLASQAAAEGCDVDPRQLVARAEALAEALA